MRKKNLQSVVLAVFLIACLLCACSPAISGRASETEKKVTPMDGALLAEPDFVNFPVTRVHYERLSAVGQQAYRLIYNAVFDHPLKIALPPITLEELKVVVTALKDDNPHLLCLKNQFSYRQTDDASFFIPKYACPAAECAARTASLIAEARRLADAAADSPDVYEKTLAVHDGIIADVEYADADFAASAYGAGVDKKAVCEGYAYLTKLVCDMAGIPCCVLRGVAETIDGKEEGHMWNAVRLDGSWYHTDVTWDDPVSERDDNLQHAYFNVTTAAISADHKEFRLPEGLSFGETDQMTYYRRQGLVCAENNWRQVVSDGIKKAMNAGKKGAEFRFLSNELLTSAVEDLFEDGGIYTLSLPAGAPEDGFTYAPDPHTLVLRIFFA